MHDLTEDLSINRWLLDVRSQFVETAPELLPLFDTYAEEALFGRRYIDADLTRLSPRAAILEVGAGSLLLSCQLKREGFDITALEPTSDGFSHFAQMRQLVLNEARTRGCCPVILDIPAEHLVKADCFDYAFSINVMEHVDDVGDVLLSVGKSLKCNASYRFTCPNYLFPYEPHFNIPTLFSKRLTERVLKQKIFASKRVPDPYGTWKSLNWISVSQLKRHVRRLPGFKITFGRSLLASTLERIISDPGFSARRSPNMQRFLSKFVRLRLHYFLAAVPALLHPIIDCSLKKINDIRGN